jgi:hypothetical protein
MRTIVASLSALLVASALLPLASCGSDPVVTGGTGGTGTGGGGGTGGHAELAVDRWGTRIHGPILALRRAGRTLWLGTRSVVESAPEGPRVRGGLGRLDLDSGAIRVFEDELPRADYELPGHTTAQGPIATGAVVEDGARVLAPTPSGVLVLEGGKAALRAIDVMPGTTASPTAIALDRAGGRARLWASTDAGLVRLNADTLEVEQRYAEVELGSANVGPLAIDPATGAVYVAVFTATGSLVARVDGDVVTTLAPGQDGALDGEVGDVVWSAAASTAYIALGSWDAAGGGVVSWDGAHVTTVVTEVELAIAARGDAVPFGASTLALDDGEGLLIVGGRVQTVSAFGELAGGGLAFVDLASGGVAGLSTMDQAIPGDDIRALAYDPETRRTYVAARQPCNELKMGEVGLFAVSFRDDGTPRLERPVLSGVRAAVVIDDRVYVGLRDDAPGAACDGIPVQSGLGVLRKNRSAEILPLVGALGSEAITAFAGPVALAASSGRFALAARREGLFVGEPAHGLALNPALSLGVSLYTNDVAWSGADAVWIAGAARHGSADDPALADTIPRGAALIRLAPDGTLAASQRFVRASQDPADVIGLPSNEVAAVVVAADGSAYLACATERLGDSADGRVLGDAFLIGGEPRLGGLVRVSTSGAIEVLASGDALPDPRALALDASGALLVLDAQRGLLRYASGALTPVALDQAPAMAYPHGLWAGAEGELASLFDRGAVVSLGGLSRLVDGTGHAWRATKRSAGIVLVGTDEGLVRVRAPGVSDVDEPAITKGATPPFHAVTPPGGGDDGGACLGAHQPCAATPDACCPGLTCGGSGIIQECQ